MSGQTLGNECVLGLFRSGLECAGTNHRPALDQWCSSLRGPALASPSSYPSFVPWADAQTAHTPDVAVCSSLGIFGVNNPAMLVSQC